VLTANGLVKLMRTSIFHPPQNRRALTYRQKIVTCDYVRPLLLQLCKIWWKSTLWELLGKQVKYLPFFYLYPFKQLTYR